MKVTRASGGDEPGQADMRLYTGDEVATGPNAQLTILFLDNVPEKDNEVLVDANARVRIGSIFTWVGRILVRCKDAFATRTEKVKLGVQGTEYELIVQRDGTNRITVLEGVVSVEKQGLASLEDRTNAWAGLREAYLFPSFTRASFVPTEPPQRKLELVAISGQITTIKNTFTFTNRCAKGHQYGIQGPRALEWFQILGADRFEIGAGQSRSIVFAIQIDAQNLAVRNYEGDIVARCLDCSQDQSCAQAGLLLPISVNVVSRSGGGGNLGSKVSARRLQEVVLNRDGVLSPPSSTLVTVYVSAPGENRVTMPPLKGADQGVAKQQLDRIGLRANVKTRETDRSAPYTVIGQKPDPGRQIPSGCSVELTVAIPIPPVTVPSYIGRNIGQVYYSADGLSLGNVVEVESNQPGGTVVNQSPKPGELVPRGTRLNLVVVVSLVYVPSVIELSLREAVRQLRAAGLDFEVVEGDSRNYSVSKQSPQAGTRVRRGTKVRLVFPTPD